MESKRSVLRVSVCGTVWDEKSRPIEVDRLEQGTGAVVFTMDDTGDVVGRMYGEISAQDVGLMLHLIRKSMDERDFVLALNIMHKVHEAEKKAAAEAK